MPSIENLIAFSIAALILNLSPGPSNLYVMARSVAQGVKGGITAAAGLAAGTIIHVMGSVLGLSMIFEHSPTAYTLVKLSGAAYLIYLGISYWRSKPCQPGNTTPAKQKPLFVVFRESMLVEITNPKTALFFIALLPQFVSPELGNVSQQLFILGIIVTISAIPCDISVAIFSSKVANWLITHEKAQQIQERISGSILFTMGAFIIADEADSFNKTTTP